MHKAIVLLQKEIRQHPVVPHSTGGSVASGDVFNKKPSHKIAKNGVQFDRPTQKTTVKRHPPSRRTRLRTKSAPKRTIDLKPSTKTIEGLADKQPTRLPKSFPDSSCKYLSSPVPSSMVVSSQNVPSSSSIPLSSVTNTTTGVKVTDCHSNTVTTSSAAAAVNSVLSGSAGATPLVRSTSSAPPPPVHHSTNTDPYYIPSYHHHYPMHNGYPYGPYPVVPYRYSPVPLYVAEVTRRYNEMYGHYQPSYYGSTHYRRPQPYHHYPNTAPVCDTGTQVNSVFYGSEGHKLSGERDQVGNGVMSDKVVKDDLQLDDGFVCKRLAVVKDLVSLLKKKLNGMNTI